MTTRNVQRVIASIAASDGAGVKLRRSLGNRPGERHDPFLMLDEFYSDDPDDYLAGFPSHPHRGFETVTTMLDGHMQHKDNLGNQGDLGPGDVQWMSAAGGIVHSEMPQQIAGRMRGFQLWVNLPAKDKMRPAAYRDIGAQQIPAVALPAGGIARVIAGDLEQEGRQVRGPMPGAVSLYLDLRLPAGAEFAVPVDRELNAFVYVYEGDAAVGDPGQPVPGRAAALLGEGDRVRLRAGLQGARLLLLAARPLREPVVQYGPFVMNTRAEIEQAIADYQSGRLTAAAA